MGCTSSDIFLIKAETYANSGDFGYPCLDGENPQRHSNRLAVASSNSLCVGNSLAGLYGLIGGGCSSSEVRRSKPKVNNYGNVINDEYYYSISASQNSTYVYEGPFAEGPPDPESVVMGPCYCCEGGVFNGNFKLTIEDGKVTENTSNCTSLNGTPPGCEDSTDNCAYGFGPALCVNGWDMGNATCTNVSEKTSEDCIAGEGKNTTSLNITLNGEINYGLLFPFTKEGVNKKIEILQNNLPQDSQNLNCGPNLNDCYGFPAGNAGFFFDTITSPLDSNIANIVTQKWRVKVAATESELKSDLSQKYQLYAYYYTAQNPDTTVSPCCNSCGCFDGTIVAQKDIKLTYDQSNKKSEYNSEYILSSDYIEFDNFEYTGPAKNLYYCSKKI